MIHLRVIGESSIQIANTKLGPGSELLFSLLFHLTAERGRVVPRARLIEFFWRNVPQSKARHCLRQAVYSLRKLGAPIETRSGGFTISRDAVSCDWENPMVLPKISVTDDSPTFSVAICPNLHEERLDAFGSWVDEFRGRVSRLLREHLLRDLVNARAASDWRRAEHVAQRILALDPLNEEATLTLAECAALRGQKREAVAMLNEYLDEVGHHSDLRVPASILRRRISARVSEDAAGDAISFVGRRDSLRWMGSLLARNLSQPGVAGFVYGPAGIGKTRLINEFFRELDVRGIRRVRTVCPSHSADQPLSLIRQLVSALLQQPGALGCDPATLALVQRLTAQPRDLPHPEPFDPKLLHAAVRTAVCDLANAIAAESTTVVVVEDIHWIDSFSLDVLTELLGTNRGRALLLLYTSRLEPRRRFLERIDRRELHIHHLAPLELSEASQYVTALAERAGITLAPLLTDRILDVGCGNPLFLSELVKNWRTLVDSARLPISIEALLEERLSRLPTAALRTLEVLALLERRASIEHVAGILGMQYWELIGALNTLERTDLATVDDGEWVVRHHVIGAAAIGRLAQAARQALHRRIAEFLYRDAKGRNNISLLLESANHWCAAGFVGNAREVTLDSASYLASVGLPEEAARLVANILRLETDSTERVELFALRNRYLLAAGNLFGAVTNCSEALKTCLLQPGIPHSSAEVELYSGWHQALAVAPRAVVERAMRCVTDPQAEGDHRISAAIWALLEMLAEPPFDPARALAGYVETIQITNAQAERQLERFRVIAASELCEFEKARFAADRLLKLVPADDVLGRARAYRMSSFPYRMLGDHAEALRRLDVAIALSRESRAVWSEWESHMQLIFVHDDLGDYGAAWREYELACDCADRLPSSSRAKLDLLGAVTALRRNNALKALALLEQHSPVGMVITYRGDYVSARVRAVLMLGQRPSAEEVALLESLYQGLRGRPHLDYVVSTLCAVYSAQGRASEAKQLATSYLGVRGLSWAPTDSHLVDALRTPAQPSQPAL